MAKLSEMLSSSSLDSIKNAAIESGTILHGPMEGVDHGKFYIIAGVSGDKCYVCSVVINSTLSQFIVKRPKLRDRQIVIEKSNYKFLDHDSFINCAQPLKGIIDHFKTPLFSIKGILSVGDLENVISQIKSSGSLSEEEENLYFG